MSHLWLFTFHLIKVLPESVGFDKSVSGWIWPDRVRSTESGIHLDRDCSPDHGNLYNMLESEQTQRHIAYLHQPFITFSLNQRNCCGVESVTCEIFKSESGWCAGLPWPSRCRAESSRWSGCSVPVCLWSERKHIRRWSDPDQYRDGSSGF